MAAVSPDRSNSGPLDGVRVLDCTRVLSGPICARMLADLGADVVKVEAPETDIMRATLPRVGGFSTMFAQLNAGKRCIGLDLKAPGGPQLLARLAAEADVFVENFRPGVLDKLGVGAEVLCERNPRLIFASISGWGQSGSWAARPAYAPMVHAETGTLELNGRLRGEPPVGETQQHADVCAGLMACNAITAALFERERSGRGQHLDIAMSEALLYVNEHVAKDLAAYDGPSDFDTWTFHSYRLADGRSVHLLGRTDQIFPALALALGREAALAEPRFASPEARAEHTREAAAVLAEWLATVSDLAALEAALASTPLVVVPMRTLRELAESDWAEERGWLFEAAPGLRVPRAPWQSNRQTIGARGGLAHRGSDNRAVLGEWLGMDENACVIAERDGALGASEDEPPLLNDAPRAAFRDR